MEHLCYRCLRRMDATRHRIYMASHNMSMENSPRGRDAYKTVLMKELDRLRLLYMKNTHEKCHFHKEPKHL